MPTMTNIGAYSTNGSISKNRKEQLDLGTEEEPDVQTVYRCSITMSAESKWEKLEGSIETIKEPAVAVNLIGSDGKDYKLKEWTGTEFKMAIGVATETAEKTIKTNYGY